MVGYSYSFNYDIFSNVIVHPCLYNLIIYHYYIYLFCYLNYCLAYLSFVLVLTKVFMAYVLVKIMKQNSYSYSLQTFITTKL